MHSALVGQAESAEESTLQECSSINDGDKWVDKYRSFLPPHELILRYVPVCSTELVKGLTVTVAYSSNLFIDTPFVGFPPFLFSLPYYAS